MLTSLLGDTRRLGQDNSASKNSFLKGQRFQEYRQKRYRSKYIARNVIKTNIFLFADTLSQSIVLVCFHSTGRSKKSCTLSRVYCTMINAPTRRSTCYFVEKFLKSFRHILRGLSLTPSHPPFPHTTPLWRHSTRQSSSSQVSCSTLHSPLKMAGKKKTTLILLEWPHISADLTSSNILLGGHIKDNVYISSLPQDLNIPKQGISGVTVNPFKFS